MPCWRANLLAIGEARSARAGAGDEMAAGSGSGLNGCADSFGISLAYLDPGQRLIWFDHVSPCCARMTLRVPVAGDGTSKDTFSA